MQGVVISDDDVAREIAPCFVERDGRRTDAIVLACTHYPLLQDFFTRLAPWPVHWINPAAAIARRADHVISDRFPQVVFPEGRSGFSFHFTSGAAPAAKLAATLNIFRKDSTPRPLSPLVAGRELG